MKSKVVPPLDRILHLLVGIFISVPAVQLGRLLRIIKGKNHRNGPVRTILLPLLDNFGDLVISSSFVQEVRTNFRKAKIVLVVDSRFLEYAQACPHADIVLGFNETGSKHLRAIIGPVRALIFARTELWKLDIDLAMNCRWDVDTRHSTLLGLFSLARTHVGFDSCSNPWKRIINVGLGSAFTKAIASKRITHDGARGAELLATMHLPSCGSAPSLWLSQDDRRFAEEKLAATTDPILALGLGASQAKRQWPARRFMWVAQRILEKWPGVKFLVVGNTEDWKKAEELRSALGPHLLNFAGHHSFGQSGALLSSCTLFVGNDSGPMHMAAAAGVPVVELSCHPINGAPDHANSPLRYYPLGVDSTILRPREFTTPCNAFCSSRSAHCILAISEDEVFKAVNDQLEDRLRLSEHGGTVSLESHSEI